MVCLSESKVVQVSVCRDTVYMCCDCESWEKLCSDTQRIRFSRCLIRSFQTLMMMLLFTTVTHPHGHWQLQELLGNTMHVYHVNTCVQDWSSTYWLVKVVVCARNSGHIASTASTCCTSEIYGIGVVYLAVGRPTEHSTPTVMANWYEVMDYPTQTKSSLLVIFVRFTLYSKFTCQRWRCV